jgi:hypothetical protein
MKHMVRAPSNDPSLAHDGPSAGAALERGDHAQPLVSMELGADRPRHDRLRHVRAPVLRFARHEVAHRRGGIRGPKNRMPEMLRLLLRFALAIVTVIVCAGIARPAGGSASLLVAAAIDMAAPDSAGAEQAREPSHHWRDGASSTVVDLKAVESDVDDDDDPLWHVPDDPALAFRYVPAPRRPDRAARGELPIDTSRFAAGTCLPRGPPT